MKYAGINFNDTANGEGVCVSFFVQGCPHHCKGCFNPETWDFTGGKELPKNFLSTIIEKIEANGVTRNFSLLGGEPLCKENLDLSLTLISVIRTTFPQILISVWTGYTLEELARQYDRRILDIFNQIDFLIDGRFELDKRDTTLKWRGSSNQRIWSRQEIQEYINE